MGCDQHGLGVVLPHLANVLVERVDNNPTEVLIWVLSKVTSAVCRACGCASSRVHSRYDRRVADAAIAGRPVVLRLEVRRFFCGNHDCSIRTFAEQVESLTTAHARRSPLLRGMLESIGLVTRLPTACSGWP